ncbi:hypothetical protein TNCV_676361 [Trichonephila clavipes]|nr:hypothetical protein TNCV_676361 [Trichonephila clavipes]
MAFPQLKESEPVIFIWQQDGAPPHWHLSRSLYLTNGFSTKGLMIKFVSYDLSPVLMPCDFYLWGLIKNCVYIPLLPADLPDLRQD